MNKSFLLLFLIITSLSFSKKNIGSINYKAILNQSGFNKNRDTLNKFNSKFDKLLKTQKEVNYILYFKDYKSVFKKEVKMKNDIESQLDLVSIFAGNGLYYYDLVKDEILIQKEVLGENFIINDNSKYKWKFTQETKKIGSFLCFKAITYKSITNRKGVKSKKPVIAWYTQDIPISLGVKDYLGLPGITIVLEEQQVTFIATKINLDNNNIEEIKKPKKGKLITQEDLNLFLKENLLNGYRD